MDSRSLTCEPCLMCGEITTKKCVACKQAWYCSRECQRDGWPEHKVHCRALQAQAHILTTFTMPTGVASRAAEQAAAAKRKGKSGSSRSSSSGGSSNSSSSSSTSISGGNARPYATSPADILSRTMNMNKSNPAHMVPPDMWLRGFKSPERYEWLSNCYSMRCDDDYVWNGCILHGPYDPDSTRSSITLDFLVFCVLARRNNVVPHTWPWAEFIEVAARFAPMAFEKSDAQDRWGSENVFDALSGGRSLRISASHVYGSGIAEDEPQHPMHTELLDLVRRAGKLSKVPDALLDEVGGYAVWYQFYLLLSDDNVRAD